MTITQYSFHPFVLWTIPSHASEETIPVSVRHLTFYNFDILELERKILKLMLGMGSYFYYKKKTPTCSNKELVNIETIGEFVDNLSATTDGENFVEIIAPKILLKEMLEDFQKLKKENNNEQKPGVYMDA
jgi:hypothetical protein